MTTSCQLKTDMRIYVVCRLRWTPTMLPVTASSNQPWPRLSASLVSVRRVLFGNFNRRARLGYAAPTGTWCLQQQQARNEAIVLIPSSTADRGLGSNTGTLASHVNYARPGTSVPSSLQVGELARIRMRKHHLMPAASGNLPGARHQPECSSILSQEHLAMRRRMTPRETQTVPIQSSDHYPPLSRSAPAAKPRNLFSTGNHDEAHATRCVAAGLSSPDAAAQLGAAYPELVHDVPKDSCLFYNYPMGYHSRHRPEVRITLTMAEMAAQMRTTTGQYPSTPPADLASTAKQPPADNTPFNSALSPHLGSVPVDNSNECVCVVSLIPPQQASTVAAAAKAVMQLPPSVAVALQQGVRVGLAAQQRKPRRPAV